MAESKQNTENKNSAASSGAASTKQAKDNDSATKNMGNQGASSAAKDTIEKVKESAATIAGQATEQVKEKAASVIDNQKSTLASGITNVADSIRQVGENLGGSEDNQVAAIAGKYSGNLADQVEKFSSYIDEREIRELVKDVEQFARRNPLLFVGGAFALGVLAARFLKSSGGKQSSKRRS